MKTMTHNLTIQMNGTEGTVIRTLGLIERRGFSLETCSVGTVDTNGRTMKVQVSSSRPGDLLKRQLERLHDVTHVELKPAPPSHVRTPRIRPVNRRT